MTLMPMNHLHEQTQWANVKATAHGYYGTEIFGATYSRSHSSSKSPQFSKRTYLHGPPMQREAATFALG